MRTWKWASISAAVANASAFYGNACARLMSESCEKEVKVVGITSFVTQTGWLWIGFGNSLGRYFGVTLRWWWCRLNYMFLKNKNIYFMIYVLIRHMMIQHLYHVKISPDIFCCTKVYQTVSVGTLIIAVPLVLTVNNGLWGWGREGSWVCKTLSRPF